MKNRNCKLAFVVDTNIIISALIKDSTRKKILNNPHFIFYTPDYSLKEINKYKLVILEKAGFDEVTFNIAMSLLFDNIAVIPLCDYNLCLKEAKDLMQERDIKDMPFLALALAKDLPIWSEDKDFLVQKKIKVYKTIDMLQLINLL